ncbi:YqkE family protein [Bacillus sp. FSL K6-3431]|uniref:YqkE family protein n=1 Tax=Bacillus sp. FSL K6-3431 TaxID=2921500 RepID=UPI0030F97452
MKNKRQVKIKDKDLGTTLKDGLNSEILEKLQQTKQELQEQELEVKRAEKEQLAKEKKQREKNKTFEELLNETSLDWKKYK